MSSPPPAKKPRTARVHEVVADDVWLAKRKELLALEKALTKQKDMVMAARQALPFRKLDDAKVDGYRLVPANASAKESCVEANGTVLLRNLFQKFQNGHQDLVVVHFMYGPDAKDACQSCSFFADGYDGQLPHFLQKANFIVVAKAPAATLAKMAERKGWTFPLFSSEGTSFNRDFDVSFTPADVEEAKKGGGPCHNYDKVPMKGESPGWSVLRKPEGEEAVLHTYSVYGRGLDVLNGGYQWQDLLPNGRAEEGLPWSMAWVKHKEAYPKPDAHTK